MAIREFTDAGGVRWRVWATTPIRGNVRPQFASGWLAFECETERRRLAPIPPLWMDADDGALRELLARAVPVRRGVPRLEGGLTRADHGEPAVGAVELESTVARVRAVLRTVEESWERTAGG